MQAIPVFYADEIVAESGGYSPSAGKPKAVAAAWEHAGLPIELRPVVPATVEELCLAHDSDFVRLVLACQVENGFGNKRADVARSLPYTCGAMLGAASVALQSGVACAPVSGFHHAGYATAKWFCTFNGLIVAARRLLRDRRVDRVLILDLDFHYGDGTDDIIDRLGLSAQVENATFGRLHKYERHAPRYMEELNQLTKRFGEFDLILYQAGADVHIDDPLGGLLTSEQMRHRDRTVFESAKAADVPVAWNLAGGYQEPISKVIRLHVATMEECVRVYVTA